MIRFVGSQMPLYSCRVRIKFNRFIIQFKVFINKLCVTFSKTNLVILNNNVARGFFSSPHKYGLCDYVRLRDKQTIFLRTFSALFTGPLCTTESFLPALLRNFARYCLVISSCRSSIFYTICSSESSRRIYGRTEWVDTRSRSSME